MPSTMRTIQLHSFDRRVDERSWHCVYCGLDVANETMREISENPLECAEFMTAAEITQADQGRRVAWAMDRLP